MASIPPAAGRARAQVATAARAQATAIAWMPLIGMLVALVLVIARRPDALLNAIASGASRRGRAVSRVSMLLLCSGAAVQVFCVAYLSHQPIGGVAVKARGATELHASIRELWRIVGGRVLLAPLIEDDAAIVLVGQTLAPLLMLVALTAGFVYLLRAAGPPLRFLLLFAAGLLVLTLVGTLDPWPVLATDDRVDRYWFIPRPAVVATLVWALARTHPAAVRAAAAGALICMLLAGVPRGWSHTPHAPIGWTTRAKTFEVSPAGTRAALPHYPVGWYVRLVKR